MKLIPSENDLTFNPNIPGYSFEYVPTPLSAGIVAIYIKDHFNYRVLEKTSNEKEKKCYLWNYIQTT